MVECANGIRDTGVRLPVGPFSKNLLGIRFLVHTVKSATQTCPSYRGMMFFRRFGYPFPEIFPDLLGFLPLRRHGFMPNLRMTRRIRFLLMPRWIANLRWPYEAW